MRIAVPTNDGTSISPHFGRSTGFLVFDVRDGQIRARELRTNTAACNHDHSGHEPHSHAGILTVLAGCDVVLCAGMGARAAEALQSGGIEKVVFVQPGPAEETVAAYLAGRLAASDRSLCRCT